MKTVSALAIVFLSCINASARTRDRVGEDLGKRIIQVSMAEPEVLRGLQDLLDLHLLRYPQVYAPLCNDMKRICNQKGFGSTECSDQFDKIRNQSRELVRAREIAFKIADSGRLSSAGTVQAARISLFISALWRALHGFNESCEFN